MRRVLLCGKSLLISGLIASLEAVPELDVQQVDSLPGHIRERIAAWQPDVLITETRLLQCSITLSLLQEFPHLNLIVLDIEDNRLQVFSGSTSNQPTPEELLQLIEGCGRDRDGIQKQP